MRPAERTSPKQLTALVAPARITTLLPEERPRQLTDSAEAPPRVARTGVTQLPVTGADIWLLSSLALLLMGSGGWLLLHQRRYEGDDL